LYIPPSGSLFADIQADGPLHRDLFVPEVPGGDLMGEDVVAVVIDVVESENTGLVG